MNFLNLAKQRGTTRGFTSQPISEDDLNYILEAGRVSPTACNRQPQRIIVVQKPDNILKVRRAYETFNAPCVLIVCRDTREALVRPFDEKCSGDLDIGIVCCHAMLAARDRGLGSVMVGLFDPYIIAEEFALPDYLEPTALLLLGYPADGFPDPKRHDTQRRPIGETVFWETFNA